MIQGITAATLHTRLEQAGVDPNVYYIGRFVEGRYCIEQLEDGTWQTYLGERGEKTDLFTWQTEGEACFFLLGMIAWDEW